jgi:hypothetical protein
MQILFDRLAGSFLQSLRQAIEKTQSNVDFKVDQDTPYGQHAIEIKARAASVWN